MECSNVEGRWKIAQKDDLEYSGTLILEQEGRKLTGKLAWSNHEDGSIIGSLTGHVVSLTLYYPSGGIGNYSAELNADGNRMDQGVVVSNTDVYGTWTAETAS